MGKWGKYLKHYNPKWEAKPEFKNWLRASSEEDVLNGKQEAYCILCLRNLRAHHHDLIVHKNSIMHKDKEKSLNKKEQQNLHNFVSFQISDKAKITELQISMYIAMHCSIRSVDHLGQLFNVYGKGKSLETIRLHRTKCSKLISYVIAPEFLKELVKDIGNLPYALIVDEATDVSVSKFLGMCVRYFSLRHNKYITDFLGLVQVTNCTGSGLADETIEYLKRVGVPLKNLHSIGTDGASAMVGEHNSFYFHLKRQVPNIILIKCVCHSLDKCAEYAFKKMPDKLDYLLSQNYNWFAHSAKRWDEYVLHYKAINDGRSPKKIPSLSKTRWLIWLPVTETILEQWSELKAYFSLQRNYYLASEIARLMSDKTNKLYLIMMKTILGCVSRTNLLFQQTNADITKIYSDLRRLIFSLASRILKSQAIAETKRPSVLRTDEIQMLKSALLDPDNHRPLDNLVLGSNFQQILSVSALNDDERDHVFKTCGQFILCICNQLIDRMPSNIVSIEKLKFLSPYLVLTKINRPLFTQLPIELADQSVDIDILESQWLELGATPLVEICLHSEFNSDIINMDVNHFWACVLSCKNAVGEQPFKELALFALKILTLPLSNAIVERLFSVMSCVKDKRRNKLQIEMLESLLRLRPHIKVNDSSCCQDFQPTKEMMSRFDAKMYLSTDTENVHSNSAQSSSSSNEEMNNDLEEDDYNNIIKIFDPEGNQYTLNL